MVLTLAYESCYKLIDKGFLEFFGIQILSVISYKIALILRKNQSGIIYHCGCLLLLWFVSLVYLFLIV